jgi:glutathione synthase/RimK-type ligase-like ATP-grasp enzyme
MKIVILAQENDNHTAPLKWALEQSGFQVVCWAGLGWSDDRQATIDFREGPRLILGNHTVEAGDVVWIRRPEQPQTNPGVAAADKKFAEGEYRWFYHSIAYLLETLPVRCVNPYSASRFINNKAVQLLLAKECGLSVPATLMSNNPGHVRNYVQASHEKLICKAFFPHIWQKENGSQVAVTETFELIPHMLPDNEVLTFAPAIYQQQVIKEFDTRMVLLGTTAYSYSLHNSRDAVDWRQDAGQGLVRVESVATPIEIEQGVLAFAKRAGITHGSFDFAVDREGRWWFLEVNESGQFLWLDEFNRNLHVQEKFLAFLTTPAGSSQAVMQEQEKRFPSWQEYLDSDARAAAEQQTASATTEVSFVSIEP